MMAQVHDFEDGLNWLTALYEARCDERDDALEQAEALESTLDIANDEIDELSNRTAELEEQVSELQDELRAVL